jgi:hypothetical protein
LIFWPDACVINWTVAFGQSSSNDHYSPYISSPIKCSGQKVSSMYPTSVARWYIFKPKIPTWVNFGRSCNGRCWYFLWPFCLFYGQTLSGTFDTFCGLLVHFFPFWYVVPKKIWQPCTQLWQLKVILLGTSDDSLNQSATHFIFNRKIQLSNRSVMKGWAATLRKTGRWPKRQTSFLKKITQNVA